MRKQCRECRQSFEIAPEDLKFYDQISPIVSGKKYAVPPPTLCPICRMQRRLAYRNDRSLYHGISALSGEPFITMYAPESGFPVYEQKEWWSDQWAPLSYGREIDFSCSFFEQFAEFQKMVPRFNVFNRDTENCEYVNYAPHAKNCYLLFGSWFNEGCLYGQTLNECKDCFDNLFLDRSMLCHENVDSAENYSACSCQNCTNVQESYFCFDCKNVKNCIGCWNLRGKSYHVGNEPVSPKEYETIRKQLDSYSAWEKARTHFTDLIRKNAICKAFTGTQNENVSGDFIFECKNVKFGFSTYRSEDLAYCSRAFELKDSYDFEGGGKGQLIYESMSNDFAYHSIGGTTCENLTDCFYCDLCFNCADCFGCISLKHEKYCVFNRKYRKEEYEILMGKIIEHMEKNGEWGEFFPIGLSPFAYNETLAQEYFPLTAEQVTSRGWRWKQEERPEFPELRKIPAQDLPDSIQEVPDEIVKYGIVCRESGKVFQIQKAELEFYRKMRLPLPRLHPDVRHQKRMALRNPRFLWERTCRKCGKSIQTTSAPERPETVFCEECYLATVY